MCRKILSVLTILSFWACSKDSTSPPNNDGQELLYDIGADHYSYKGGAPDPNFTPGVFAWRSDTGHYYTFSGFMDIGNYAHIVIRTDSLQATTYVFDNSNCCITAMQLRAKGESYTSIAINDVFSITITSYNNGIVEGTFSGTAHSDRSPNDPNYQEPVTVSNGKIIHAVMHYY